MTVIPLHQPAGFDEWWQMLPPELRQDKPLCHKRFDAITSRDGYTAKVRDSEGNYDTLHHKATAAEIIEGTAKLLDNYRLQIGWHPDIRYVKRAPQFLNHGCWQDHE